MIQMLSELLWAVYGPQGRAGERPLYQNNSTASKRCDINNKVLTLPQWALLTADPPSLLQRTHNPSISVVIYAHSQRCQIVAPAISALPSFQLLISQWEEESMKNEWLPYGSDMLYEKRKKLLVWKINFVKSQTYSFLLGKRADISQSSRARLSKGIDER